MTVPTVKKKQITVCEWNSFVEVLQRIDPKKVQQIVKDNQVTDDEMNSLLDRNSDGKVTHRDFKSLQGPLFDRIKELLQKHGFGASRLWRSVAAQPDTVPRQFWSDRDFVLLQVRQNGRALKYADAELKKDEEVALTAIKENGEALSYVDAELQDDYGFFLKAVQQNYRAWTYANARFTKFKNAMLEVINNKSESIRMIDILLWNRDIILALVKRDGNMLYSCDPYGIFLRTPDIFKSDREIVFAAVKENGRAIKYAADILKKNRDFVFKCAKVNFHALYGFDRYFR